MVTGDGFGRLIRPAQVTPLPSAVTQADNPLPEAIAGLGRFLESRARPELMRRAADAGAQDGAAGTIQNRPIITDMDEAYLSAARQAYLAREEGLRDEKLDDLAAQFAGDPQGFENAAREAMTGVVTGAAPTYAVAIEQSWARGIQRRLRPILRARQAADAATAKDNIDARVATLRGRLQALARVGELGGDEAAEVQEELDRLWGEKQANPLWRYGAAENERERAALAGEVAGLSLGRQLLTDFETMVASGKTALEARATALSNLNTAFETNEALRMLPEAERKRIRGMADDAFTNAFEARAALRRAEEDAEREADRQQRERYEANFNTYLPMADSGALTIPQINALADRGEITQRQADALRSQTRAAATRAYTEQRRAQAAERQAAAAERSAAADERRAAREGAQNMVYDLRDRAETDPDGALREARRLHAAGVLNRADLNSVRNAAQSEWNDDDKERIAGMRQQLRSMRLPPERMDVVESRYRQWADQNPNATTQARDLAARSFVQTAAAAGAASISPTRELRTLQQVREERRAVEGSAMPDEVKAERLDALNREERRIRAAQ